MKRLVMMAVTAGAAMAASAMPTKQDLQKAQEMVSDVTAADVAALKAKTKTPAEVAAKHMELAGQAASEAEKYLLLQAAFKLYAKAGDYEGAANALGAMYREITEMNPEVIVEIYNKAIFSSMKEKAPKLYAIKEFARRQVVYRKQLAKASAAVKADPKDVTAQKKLGECHAELGDWSKALDAFALAGGNLAKAAAAEKDGSAAPQTSGDFWWDYESGDEMSTYKLHAAELYRVALTDASFKGLARTRTEQRVKLVDKEAVDLPQMATDRGESNLIDASLAHRWSFDKDFIDSIGKVEAKKIGEHVELKNGQCVMEQGGLDIDDVLPKDGSPFTVELWYTETQRRKGGLVVELSANQSVLWVTGEGKEGYFNVAGKTPARGLPEMNFELNHKYLLAITYDGREITAYKFDLRGKGLLFSYPIAVKHMHFSGQARLGKNGIFARFDEVRIWRVCKSKEDIEATIKAGPDRVVMPKAQPAPSTMSTPAQSFSSCPAPMTFDLADDVKLEMLGCPAGEFDWLAGGKMQFQRPFWLGKVSVTVAQWVKLVEGKDMSEEEVKRDFPKGSTSVAERSAFMEKLNQKFATKCPRGYVFRLPTEAELKYALTCGGRIKEQALAAFGPSEEDKRKYVAEMCAKPGVSEADKKWLKKVTRTKVGLSKPNDWGFYDVVGNGEHIASDRSAEGGDAWNLVFRVCLGP